jgi:DNA polymerase
MNKHKNIAADAEVYLEYLKQSGVKYILHQGQSEINITPQNGQAVLKDHSEKDLSPSGSSPSSLELLNKEIANCSLCKLGQTRTNIVYGVGNPDAELVFVGEAPGRDEDQQGIPFVGRAGRLLTKIIEAMDLKREDVYICNIIKCRPPENRNPLPEEIEACEPFLIKQLESIKPKAICALGKFAAQTLLKTETPISTLRGSFQDYHGIPLMPTYHPAYLLRNPRMKKAVWEDMKLLRKRLRKRAD